MALNAFGEERRLLPVMSLRNRLASCLEDIPWNALLGQRVQEPRREEAMHHIGELAGIAVDLLDAQVPDHTYFHPACWRKNVRVGDEPQVMRFGKLLDIMLHHWISAEDFDVDGHTPTIRRRGYSGRNVSR